MSEGPEKKFQRHIADYLKNQHGYTVLAQSDITDTEYYFAEDHLIAFIKATQKSTYKSLKKDYGTDARDEIFKTLKKELRITPLWLIFRNGLNVRGLTFRLCYPKPRSKESIANKHYRQNRFSLKEELIIGKGNRPDVAIFLNGLPIITMELKHEKNQNVHDAVEQYIKRNHKDRIFQLPFLHIAADTSEVMVATDPRQEKNFRWHNTGLKNAPITQNQYPVEFLYRDILSPDAILEALSFYLIFVPEREATDDRSGHSAFSIFPRYHQSRMVNNLSKDMLNHFSETGSLGKKYLIEHSAGSGKTLSICWLADRLHSLYKPGTNEKVVNIIFVLTDRKALDKNIREEMEKLTHLSDVVAYAKKSHHLKGFINTTQEQIIVTTQQKFKYVLKEIALNPELKKRRVAFLIDEAHRSQEGKTAVAVKVPFRDPDATDIEEENIDPQDEINNIIRAHDANQLFVAFTATPSSSTLQLFGNPFDTYTENEAIQEGYILDVATSIISYKTLYHLQCPVVPGPDEERIYPKGTIAKLLKNVAYQDDGLIQYKAEVMLRIFGENVSHLIDGRAKTMIVATSRIAGLRYFRILREKIRERKADYKVLYAFSPFVHPETNESIRENEINDLKPGEHIEDRFQSDDYRLMVVTSKFLAGFNQPLLAGMFLDKVVEDRNAVQTISRMNRWHKNKDRVVIVDFTNNAGKILKAFAKYRKGTPFEAREPDKTLCTDIYQQILKKNIFSQRDAENGVSLIAEKNDAKRQYHANVLRTRFRERIQDREERKAFVNLLSQFVKTFHFLSNFFQYPEEIEIFAAFSEYVGPQLIKQGNVSELIKQIRKAKVVKAAVKYEGEAKIPENVSIRKKSKSASPGPATKKVSVQDVIDEIRNKFSISDEEALIIREVAEEKMQDETILYTIRIHKDDEHYLRNMYAKQINEVIQDTYEQRDRYEALWDPKYIDDGAIFDIMAFTIVEHGIQVANRI